MEVDAEEAKAQCNGRTCMMDQLAIVRQGIDANNAMPLPESNQEGTERHILTLYRVAQDIGKQVLVN